VVVDAVEVEVVDVVEEEGVKHDDERSREDREG